MKKFLKNFQMFIDEQQKYFYEHLAADFNHSWSDDTWYVGTYGTGWLQGSGKGTLPFDAIHKSTKGFDKKFIIDSKDYKQFMKAVLVAIYRQKRSISTSVAVASILILKRWYHSLLTLTGQKHPIYLTTAILQDAMNRYQISSKINDPNVAFTLGRCNGLQDLINHYAFCLSSLGFKSGAIYINKTNYTKKAMQAQIDKKEVTLNDVKVNDKNKLITISTFLNVVALIDKCETVGQKILLNLVMLLIVTGFRSIEAITLRKDSLVKREIEDLVTREKLEKKGVPLYFLGIRYVGAKGTGERIHWVEPLAIPLVEAIFSAVIELTEPLRKQLTYLRNKNFSDYLPNEISNLPSDLVELDDIDQFIVGTLSNRSGRGIKRDKTYVALNKAGIKPVKGAEKNKRDSEVYYRKEDLSQYIADNFMNNKEQLKEPCMFVWQANNKRYNERYEDLLFIHHYRSTNMKQLLTNKANPIPFENRIINKFLGSSKSISAFQKYGLKETNGEFSSLTSHIPRHNINTFLAIADISDHLQAMLMGRIDISQNEHYKHVAIEQRRKAASVLPYKSQAIANKGYVKNVYDAVQNMTPLETIKKTGVITGSKNMDVENNLKANLHTFDGRDDVAKFIEASFLDGIFDDINDSFEELKGLEGYDVAKEFVRRHAELHPLKFGSCTYNIALWGCSYRLKCQSGEACNHFALTGRADEVDKLLLIKENLKNNLCKLEGLALTDSKYIKMVNNIKLKLKNISLLETQAEKILGNREAINIYESLADNNEYREFTTLADLFALEYINQKAEEQ